MAINTALTEALGLEYPIVLAPMGSISGGRLAAAVSNAGGQGLVGGGYGDHVWLRDELSVAKAETVRPWGVGLITWATTHETVQLALSYEHHTFMFSFGDPRPHALVQPSKLASSREFSSFCWLSGFPQGLHTNLLGTLYPNIALGVTTVNRR